ncbi:MAG: hypothetical protein QE263_09525 [Vampirovibrionales bacterium]|nr:hypothetical protein [Vampirovibrionales bacterium]
MLNLTTLRFAATPPAFSAKTNRATVPFAANADTVQFGQQPDDSDLGDPADYPSPQTIARLRETVAGGSEMSEADLIRAMYGSGTETETGQVRDGHLMDLFGRWEKEKTNTETNED